ncbi:MAG: hypothetical protein IPG60_06635 [Bacteroidetes bacterium]|nr:hypothetical protein [Bacteroidota bacterium]MBK7110413.1 hypothetical protein [Bacteroidota bacterium]MBK8488315.1 hypothetical protein [Bacteroidota bacterium]MBK8681934.1 hypothetical protein [Bacteroidota bacterium]
MKETQLLLYYTSVVSSVLIGFNLLAIYTLINYYDLVETIRNEFIVLSVGLLLGVLNHFLIVRKEKFLKCGFKKSIGGGLTVIMYILITATLTITVANLNRAKLEDERLAIPLKTEKVQKQKDEKPNSLEGRIRKWFKETF